MPGPTPQPVPLTVRLPGERRARVRYPGPATADVQVFDTRACISQCAMVANLSAAGIALLLDKPVPVQTLLHVEVEHLGLFHKFMARVVYSVRLRNGWLLGCKLTRALSTIQVHDLVEA
jgi:hypothetical protein